MTGQAIPQDNRIAHTSMEQSKQGKYCFNLPNDAQILYFNKLNGEHNTKKYIKRISFCGSISLKKEIKVCLSQIKDEEQIAKF